MKIINLGNTIYTNYILETEAGLLLVDFGFATSYNKFLKKLNKAGFKKEDIKCAILTHTHQDHLSFMKDLLDDIHPTLYVGEGARENILKGYDNHVYYTSKFNRDLTKLTLKIRGGPAKWTPFDISEYNPIYVDKKIHLDNLNIDIMPLKGHTLDGIGFLTSDGIFVVGDAIMNSLPAKNLIPLLVESVEELNNTYDLLVESKATVFYSGHGGAVSLEKLKKQKEAFRSVKEF